MLHGLCGEGLPRAAARAACHPSGDVRPSVKQSPHSPPPGPGKAHPLTLSGVAGHPGEATSECGTARGGDESQGGRAEERHVQDTRALK